MKLLMKITLLMFACNLSLAASELVYVNSKKAKLYQEPNYQSKPISELEKGDELQVVKSESRWIQVKSGPLSGWIPRYSVSETPPPKEKISFFNRLKSFFSSDSKRTRTSTVSTVGGIRGLADEESENSGSKDYQAVEKMEQITVTDEEVDKFIEGTER